jgi:hypothetical protein
MLLSCLGVVDCHTALKLVETVTSKLLISGETQCCRQ